MSKASTPQKLKELERLNTVQKEQIGKLRGKIAGMTLSKPAAADADQVKRLTQRLIETDKQVLWFRCRPNPRPTQP